MNIDFDVEFVVNRALDSLDLGEVVEELVINALRSEIQSLIYHAVKDRKESFNDIIRLSLDTQEALLKSRG